MLEDVVQAIQLEGGDQVVGQLNKIASIGEQTFARIAQALESGAGGFSAFGIGVAGTVTALAAATAATVAFVESQDRAITSLSALANSFSTSIAGIQGIKEGFAEAGVSGTMVERGFMRMQRTISQSWSEIGRSVRESATSQTKDHIAIQEATLGTEKAVESLASAESAAANLGVHQAQERINLTNSVVSADNAATAANTKYANLAEDQAEEQVRAINSVAEAREKLSTMAAHQDEERVSSANTVMSAELRLREAENPGSVSASEKKAVAVAEAQAALNKALNDQAELPAKQALARAQAEAAMAEAQTKLRELAQKQVEEAAKAQAAMDQAAAASAEAKQKQREIAEKQAQAAAKAETAVKDAVLAVEKARLAETEAAQKSHDLDLRNLPKIAEQLHAIAQGHGEIKGAVDLTEVSADKLAKATILAANNMSTMGRPTGIAVFKELANTFKGLGDSTDAMSLKMQLVQRLMASGFRGGGGAGMAEMVDALNKGGTAFDDLIAKVKASPYALDESAHAAKDTVSAYATLEGTFGRVTAKLAEMASPTVTEWLKTLNSSLENSDGNLHKIVDGIEHMGKFIGGAIEGFKQLGLFIDHAFNMKEGTTLSNLFGLIPIIKLVVTVLGGWIDIFKAIGVQIGKLIQSWDSIKTAVHNAAQSVSDFEKSLEEKIHKAEATLEGPFVNAWKKVSNAIADAKAWLDKYVGTKVPPPPSVGGSGPGGGNNYNSSGPDTEGKWRGGLIGTVRGYAAGGPVRGFAGGGLVGAVRGFAGGGLAGFADGGELSPKTWLRKLKESPQILAKYIKENGPDKAVTWLAEKGITYGIEGLFLAAGFTPQGRAIEIGASALTNVLASTPVGAADYNAGAKQEEDAARSMGAHNLKEADELRGKVNGPGTGTSDSIPARLSNGEFVIKADAVRAYGEDNLNAINAGQLPDASKNMVPRELKPGEVYGGGSDQKTREQWDQDHGLPPGQGGGPTLVGAPPETLTRGPNSIGHKKGMTDSEHAKWDRDHGLPTLISGDPYGSAKNRRAVESRISEDNPTGLTENQWRAARGLPPVPLTTYYGPDDDRERLVTPYQRKDQRKDQRGRAQDQIEGVGNTVLSPAREREAMRSYVRQHDENNRVRRNWKRDEEDGYHVTQYAGGGHIRGPGSGTSDSIFARLSNGEFVMRAAAVRAYGADLFEKLNNMQFPGFAMGGLVPATVGRAGSGSTKASSTVNLTIDGHQFNGLTAPQDVADKLTQYAIGRQTSSAGRQPSWVK